MKSDSKTPFLRLPIWLAIAFAGYIVFVRLLPYLAEAMGMQIDPEFGAYPWNFSPVMALCLFGGSRFLRSGASWAVAFGGMLISDLAILAIKGPAFAFSWITVGVYLGFGFGLLLGRKMRQQTGTAVLVGGGIVAEVVFFAVTNFLVWLVFHNQPPMHYPLNLGGLSLCYWSALPFFGRSLVSTMLYGGLLFGAWAWISRKASSRDSLNAWVVREA